MKFLGTIFIATVLLIVLPQSWQAKSNPQPEPAPARAAFTLDSAQHLPDQFIAHGNYTFQSESLCPPAYDDLRRLGIQVVVRLNGDGKDAGCMSVADEATLAHKHGIRLYYYNIDGGDAIDDILPLLEQGRAVVHCKHGAHRAALVMGIDLLRRGVTVDEVEEMIGWTQGKRPVVTDPNYRKYVRQLRAWADYALI